ncbi:MAG: methyltransferase [Psychroserpens sp.]|nr:methyltransferase [Psychroserpens sp.]
MSKPFKFKHFSVEQDRCAMKIGTDGVLLGAWTTVKHNPFSILDIGAGTGVLSLMLAQRSNAEIIEAIEIDDDAYEQCVTNFENSDWSDKLFCYHASLLEFTEQIDDNYDLIICNPPFYSAKYKTKDKARDLARFQDAMPFEHLLFSASKLLSDQGVFSVILPYSEADSFVELASEFKLFPNRICNVKGNSESKTSRSLLELSFNESELSESIIIIENGRHNHTDDYINLTKDFYLKM